ncbi:MAG: hypothetical protein QW400_00105 [Candidatus Diapherotrites archaeon]
MENAVWVVFGIITVFLAMGILLTMVENNREQTKIKTNENAVKAFAQWCNFVCDSEVETRLGKEIEISSGAVMSGHGKGVCIDYKNNKNCEYCKCDVNAIELNLNEPDIIKAYDTHAFRCIFEKTDIEVVAIECRGT